MGLLFKAHPWHGVPIGNKFPKILTAYIEIVPTDTVKYEIDKDSGILKLDRPQKFSNVCPVLYGLVPQTFCAEKVAEFCELKTGRKGITGDGDPLDICILTEKTISHGDILLQAVPIGGMRMIDDGEADDKIIAVLQGDGVYGNWKDISDCPASVTERLKHYFLTYKDIPGETKRKCEITHVYGVEEACEVITRSHEDYLVRFSELESMLNEAMKIVNS
ncbi:inorganic pyrophosphatase [bacterium]|nr:inorganic pyrophosphatase [bacterium]